MKERLIEFKTAKLANRKGFDEEIFDKYTTDGFNVRGYVYKGIKAPTQSLLQKWLREKYNIYVEPRIINKHKQYEVLVYNENCELIISHFPFKSYESALEKGLYESLKEIKDEKID